MLRIFAMAVRTQFNFAAHKQVNKKMWIDDFLTISTFTETGVCLKDHSLEFH